MINDSILHIYYDGGDGPFIFIFVIFLPLFTCVYMYKTQIHVKIFEKDLDNKWPHLGYRLHSKIKAKQNRSLSVVRK